MRPIVYRIDEEDRLVEVNQAWVDFAEENDGAGVRREVVVGRALWEFISDLTVKEIYRRVVERVRSGKALRFDYRCDSPGERREFEMAVGPLGPGRVEFVSTLRDATARAPLAIFDAATPRSGTSLVRMCGWCHAIALDDTTWAPLEEALAALRLLDADTYPRVSHGICDACAERTFGLLEAD